MNIFITTSLMIAMALLEVSSTGVVPAAPLAVGYAHAVPQNVPPFASRVDISSRVRAAPLVAAPVAPVAPAAYAAPPIVAHAAAPVAAPLIAGAPALHPYFAAPIFP